MSTDTSLRERLHDLADDAPHGGFDAADLWRSGVRRQRRRSAAAVAGVVAVVALVVGLGSVVDLSRSSGPAPAEGPAELGIPREVRAPDPWSEPTRAPGPLSAISSAMHSRPEGLADHRSRMMLFGVSAVDGVARFLDVPGRPRDLSPEPVALSADGTRVAVLRLSGRGKDVSARGWDVLDTTTGEITRLRVPGQPELLGHWGYDVAFTGDGRYLQTSFSTSSDDNRADSLVAWDLETGERHVAEGPGHYWIPGRATASSGVVWTRGREVLRFDPAAGRRSSLAVPHQLVDAAFSPSGSTLAYIGHGGAKPNTTAPWRLYSRDVEGRIRRLDVDIEPGWLLGWRDEEHVVVSRYGPREARVVDVTTGEWEPLPLGQGEGTLLTPEYATDLLSRDVAAPVDQPVVGDPRPWTWPWVRWTVAATLALLLAAAWLRRRRGRA